MITQTVTVTNLSFVAAMYCVATTSAHYRDLYYSYWVIYSEWSCMTGEVYRSNHALVVGVTCHNN